MEDYKFVWYILAAIIYFITRKKKKKAADSRPGSENNPSPQAPGKSFEDLLKEITGDGQVENETPKPRAHDEVAEYEEARLEEPEEQQRLEGERRAFADDESRRVYEESIKRAEGFDLEYKPDEHYHEPKLFKGDGETEEKEYTFADEIRDGLSSNEARKAIIYSEILNRKY